MPGVTCPGIKALPCPLPFHKEEILQWKKTPTKRNPTKRQHAGCKSAEPYSHFHNSRELPYLLNCSGPLDKCGVKKEGGKKNLKKRTARGEGDKQTIHKGITAALYGISRSQRGVTGNTGRRLRVNHGTGIDLSCCLKINVCPLPTAGLVRRTPPRGALGGHRRGKFCFSHFAEVPRTCLESNHAVICIISNSLERGGGRKDRGKNKITSIDLRHCA